MHRHAREQITAKLKEIAALTARGQPLALACRHIGISATSYYRWKKRYGECAIGPAELRSGTHPDPATSFLSGHGGMIEAVRAKDWSQTPLGEMATWPDSLRTSVSICLNSQFPLDIWWGSELALIYNEAHSAMLGDKHPCALGRPGAEVWPEIWSTIGPMLKGVLNTGAATRDDDRFFPLERHGFVEECYFTFSYSPIRIENGTIGGVFTTVLETTKRVLNERRLRTLSDLATRISVEHERADIYSGIREVLSRNPFDLPFAALYLVDAKRDHARLAFCSGLAVNSCMPVERVPLDAGSLTGNLHPIAPALQTSEAQLCGARAILGDTARCGVWAEPPNEALVQSFRLPGQALPRGVFVVGVNPRRPLDKEYREFYDLVLGHMTTAVTNAEAFEAERRRVEAMAELDRTKSLFFSSASHELRTPVTLILGPLNDILERDGESLEPAVRGRLESVRRNASRLHKLVDSFLDFTGIEAGRLLLRMEPTDVGTLTAELASLFRSAIESTGLRYSVRCSLPVGNVLIDREMWEKVVLNLISNAFKFTASGGIDIALECDLDFLYLKVRDTGAGIAPDDLPHIFERFFRGRSAGGRSIEGSGIGLSLAQELVRLHDGHIQAQSTLGKGSVFTVRIPLRRAQALRLADNDHDGNAVWRVSGKIRDAYDDEAQRYACRNAPPEAKAGARRATGRLAVSSEYRTKVLIVDDNDDFIRYIERLLEDGCDVISAHDGISGLEVARQCRPDLIVLDVMMPGMDGFGLLNAIRADETIHTIPVIMLSAQAGEQARLEALKAGADDYLIKPFSSRELIARVHSHVQMARIRRDAVNREGDLLRQIAKVQQDLERVLEGTSDSYANLDQNLRIITINDAAVRLLKLPRHMLTGHCLTDVSPDVKGSALEQAMRTTIQGYTVTSAEHFHVPSGRWLSIRCFPTHQGLFWFGTDITERKKAEEALRVAHAELECRVEERTKKLRAASELLTAIFDRAPGGIAITDIEGRFIRANVAYQELMGYSEHELLARSLESFTDPADYPRKKALLQQLLNRERESFEMEMHYRLPNGGLIWVNNFVSLIVGEGNRPYYFVKITQNITDRKRAEEEILSSQKELCKLYDRLQTVRKEERVTLAREVHDQLGQILSAAKIDIKLLEDDIRRHDAVLSRRKISIELRSARRTIEKAIHTVRKIATELRAPELDGQGLRAAIEWHARDFERRTRIRCNVSSPAGMQDPVGEVAEALFRIFQEAMTNVLRHAKAGQIWVTLAWCGRTVLLRVRDDGVGIPRASARSTRSLGLKGMRERAAIAGGRLVVGALRPHGTLVAVRVPFAGEAYPFNKNMETKLFSGQGDKV
jgi:PAS domain S-box-containing protein